MPVISCGPSIGSAGQSSGRAANRRSSKTGARPAARADGRRPGSPLYQTDQRVARIGDDQSTAPGNRDRRGAPHPRGLTAPVRESRDRAGEDARASAGCDLDDPTAIVGGIDHAVFVDRDAERSQEVRTQW